MSVVVSELLFAVSLRPALLERTDTGRKQNSSIIPDHMPLLHASLAQSHGSEKDAAVPDLGVFPGLLFVVVFDASFTVVSLNKIQNMCLFFKYFWTDADTFSLKLYQTFKVSYNPYQYCRYSLSVKYFVN